MTGFRGFPEQGQLALPFAFDRDSLEKALGEMTGRAVTLTVTDNSTNMLSVRGGPGQLRVRLHRVFLGAGPEVLGEIAAFISGRARRTPLIREYLRARPEALSPKRPRPSGSSGAGRCHDLGEIFRRLNAEYFGGRLEASIGWGRKCPCRRVRKRVLGSYCRRTGKIRVNPLLDSPGVPSYFVEFVVYHEMLHADVGEIRAGGRTYVHTREFRVRERSFRQYEQAVRWEESGRHVR